MDLLPSGARRVAFFGGSFDPPHLGHVAVARAARAALQLDAVLFAPVGAQPLKPQGSSASFDDRLAMTRLAIAGEPEFAISLADAPNASGTPNYTLETLRGFRAELPAGGELFCLMGADSFLNLRQWRRAAEIPFAAQLIVASRPGQSLDDLAAALPTGLAIKPAPELASGHGEPGSPVEIRSFWLQGSGGDAMRFYLLPGLYIEISATEIREHLRLGSGAHLLSPAVADYILSHHLYR